MKVLTFIVTIATFWHVLTNAQFTDDQSQSDYENIANILATYQTIDPRTKTKLTEREILSYKKPIIVYAPNGIAVSTNQFRLDSLFQEFQEYVKITSLLEALYASSPFVQSAMEARKRVSMQFQSICEFDDSKVKRDALFGIRPSNFKVTDLNPQESYKQATNIKEFFDKNIPGTVRTLGSGVIRHTLPTSIITFLRVGFFPGSESSLVNETSREYLEEVSEDVQGLSEFFNEKFGKLENRTETEEDHLEINEQAYAVENHLKRMQHLLQFLLNPDTYDFTHYNVLEVIETQLKNNSKFNRLMDQTKFGLIDKTSLMTLSETQSILLSTEDIPHCSTARIYSKFSTILADDKTIAKKTEDKYRYYLEDQKSLYLNPDFLMPQSKFRPHHTFSKMRKIIADDRVVSGVLPYNNSHIFVNTIGNLGEVKKTCPNHSETMYIYQDPFFVLPYGCSLRGKGLNISTFEVIYSFTETNKDVEKFDFGEDFSALYHKATDDRTKTYEHEMEERIHNIFNLEQRITQLEMEELQTKDWNKRFTNKVDEFWYTFTSMLSKGQSALYAEPLYQLLVGLVVLLVTLIWYVFVRRFRRRKRYRQQYLQLIGQADNHVNS